MKPEKHPSLFTWRRRLLYTTPRRSESSLMLLLLHCCTNKSQPRARPHAGPGVTLTRGHHLTGPTWQVLADLYWCLLSVVNLLLAIQAHHGNVALPRYALNCYILPPFYNVTSRVSASSICFAIHDETPHTSPNLCLFGGLASGG
jgi:hypothetical protein